VIDKGKYGIYHASCEGGGSRFDVAKAILEINGLESNISLNKVDSTHFKKDYYAPRPRSEKLINSNLKSLGINLSRDWRVCLEEYMNKFDWQIPNVYDKSLQAA
ncbi:sugar nucleotide-binding protein, partial [Candidatus Pacearchaeota archaeon]|nr:sugar nucleotide-binding protein [Candidatus Pacearchaeota archaeon]